VTFRTPHIEAAGLGYFEDYAREMSLVLEAFLDERGQSLGDLTGETYPFVPVEWDLTIERSIAFEDEIDVVGRVVEVGDETVEVAYEFRRAGTGEVCIRAALAYGCLDGDGERVAFPPAAIEAVAGR
jgi:acyl-CoA thioesterase FadM